MGNCVNKSYSEQIRLSVSDEHNNNKNVTTMYWLKTS